MDLRVGEDGRIDGPQEAAELDRRRLGRYAPEVIPLATLRAANRQVTPLPSLP